MRRSTLTPAPLLFERRILIRHLRYVLPLQTIIPVFIVLLFSPAGAQQISNCPASPYPITVKQADGTALSIIGKGGMLHSWTETLDGYSVVQYKGVYQYATKANGKLVASGVNAANKNIRKPSEKIFLQKLSKSLTPDPLSYQGQARFYPSTANPLALQRAGYPRTGNHKALMLLIKYPDLKDTYAKSNFNDLMNKVNYRGTGSFKDFFSTSSFGKLNVNTDVFGWYTAANSYSYYSYSNGFLRSTELVREAVNAAEAAGVDFSKYDNDGDGVVDGIIIAHAGPGAEEGSQGQYIWSHRWVLSASGRQATYDGVLIDDYIINPERRLYTADMVGRGIFCHEFGHNLGLPDLYDVNGGSEGIGEWSLMASASWLGKEHTPGNMCAWCRKELGWVNPVVIKNKRAYSLAAASLSTEVYRINTPLANEYFLLENRQKTGLDISLNGSGLAIFHINSYVSGNSDENLKAVDLEEADGFNDLDNQYNRGDAGDLFPGSSNTTAFNNLSNPNSKTYTNVNTDINISNISIDASGKALFNLDLNNGPVVNISDPLDKATFVAPAAITIKAEASSSAGGITNVDFYNGSVLLKSDYTPPYNYTWKNIPAGVYALTAKATDNGGIITTSDVVTISVVANQPPGVSITSPANNSAYAAPATFIINAVASDADGSIKSVAFYNGGTLLKTDSTSPYNCTVNKLKPGNYSFTAKATDDKGLSGPQATIAISVTTPNTAPSVNILTPVAGQIFTTPATVNIEAIAQDPDGTISKVDFYNGITLLITERKIPYTYQWQNMPAGSYVITAVATDNLGNVTTSPPINISVITNQAPVVSLIRPTVREGFVAPATVNMEAAATDTDGTMSRVDFYSGTTLLVTERKFPYTYQWQNVPAGAYNLTAVATDNLGRKTTSKIVTLTVAPGFPAVSERLGSKNGIKGVINLDVTPNPVNEVVNISISGLPENQPKIFTILSPSGRRMKTMRVNHSAQKCEFNIAFLPTGVYTIRLRSGDKQVYKRFVKL